MNGLSRRGEWVAWAAVIPLTIGESNISLEGQTKITVKHHLGVIANPANIRTFPLILIAVVSLSPTLSPAFEQEWLIVIIVEFSLIKSIGPPAIVPGII